MAEKPFDYAEPVTSLFPSSMLSQWPAPSTAQCTINGTQYCLQDNLAQVVLWVNKKLMDKFNYVGCLYGHFGQGCIHTRLDFDLKSADGVQIFRSFIEESADLVVKYGGSFSGEHGDGQSRAELLPKMFGEELIEAFNEFKSIWDPDWKMNPGKIVRPYRITDNLRYGPT